MTLIVEKLNVIHGEVVNVLNIRIEPETREWERLARKLFLHLFDVVQVDVNVPESMDELSYVESANLGNHVRKKSIGGNIKGDPEKKICTPLIKLTRKLSVSHVKLEKDMARWKSHPG